MLNAYIVDGVRSPIGNLGGSLSMVRPDDLAATTIRELMHRHPQIDASHIDDVVMGSANQAGEDNRNVARMALLLAGLPHTVPGETVNRLCASGLSAAINAARAISCGDTHLMIAGGVESMTRSPWVVSKSATPFARDAQMFDTTFGWRFVNPEMKKRYGTDAMGETAENVAHRDAITREHQDAFALWSQQKAASAQASGRLAKEICPIIIPQKKGDPITVINDEFIKPTSSMEGLSKLKPAFKHDGTVTAGNASGMNDGAAALLLASAAAVSTHQLSPLARIVSAAAVGAEPRIMGIGPVAAANLAIEKAGISWSDIDILELNEAFAAQALACTRAWGLPDNDPRINPNGGAIALGHPLGMSGARLLLTAAMQLHIDQKQYALVTMCVGVGQGVAVVLQRAK